MRARRIKFRQNSGDRVTGVTGFSHFLFLENKSRGILIAWKRLRSMYEVIKKGKIMKIAMKILGSVIAFSIMIILWVLALVISVGIPTMAILFILDAVKLINIW